MRVYKKEACSGCNSIIEYTSDDIHRSRGLYIGTQWCCTQDDTGILYIECPKCFMKIDIIKHNASQVDDAGYEI